MDDFRTASYELSVVKGRLTLLSEKIQKAPDEDMFSDTAATMARTFKQPACMSQINQQTIDSLNAAQEAIDKSVVDCAPTTTKLQPKPQPKSCMRIVYSGPPTENAELAEYEAFQFHIPAAQRSAIAANLQKCLDETYAERRSGQAVGRAPYSFRQWYTKTSDGFDYCATYDPIVVDDGILVHCDHVDTLPNGILPGSR
jgi:hypothetical protein